jgi:hypothetical protein
LKKINDDNAAKAAKEAKEKEAKDKEAKDKEAKQKAVEHQKYLCRKPITDCWDKCPAGAGNQKCKDACSDKLAPELGRCSERAMQ